MLFAITAQAQTDTSTFRAYDKTFNIRGETHKDVKWINNMFEVLVIDGDSVYNTSSLHQIETKLRNGNYRMDIVNNPDSIIKIISAKIKSIMIMTKEPAKKPKP
jgi:hypothetical protein